MRGARFTGQRPLVAEEERAKRRGEAKRWGLGVLGAGVVVAVTALAFGLRPNSPAPTTALGAPRFVDETAAAGLDHTYDGGPNFAVGGGVAAFDCNDDGKPDLFIAGGRRAGGLFR